MYYAQFSTTHSPFRYRLAAVALAAVMLLVVWGCADRTISGRSGKPGEITIAPKIAEPGLITEVASFRLTVSAPDLDTIEEWLDFDGCYITGRVEVPSGLNREFLLEALDSRGMPGAVVYQGWTVADVLPDRTLVLDIEMVPVVPLIRVSPRYVTVYSGTMTQFTLSVRNMIGLRGLQVRLIDSTGYLTPLRARLAEDLNGLAILDMAVSDDYRELQIRVEGVQSNPVVDEAGAADLAVLTYGTSTLVGLGEEVPLVVSSLTAFDVDTSAPPLGRIFSDIPRVLLLPMVDGAAMIPDSSLRAAVRGVLGQPTGDLMLSSLLDLESLWAAEGFGPITDLTGMSHLRNLRLLELTDQAIVDLTPLTGMYRLWSLSLRRNDIGNLDPLEGLIGLEDLRLGENNISDLAPLTDLDRLKTLDLSYNQIVSVANLAGLTDLEELHLAGNQITDVAPLGGLRSLRLLTLGENGLSDISALAALESIRELRLDYNVITDIAPLMDNAGLGSGDLLDLYGNPLNAESQEVYIPQLRSRGVIVVF